MGTKKIRVTQTRSATKHPERQRLTLHALGLQKIGHSVVHDISLSIVGMIEKVAHLVSVRSAEQEEQ